MINFIIKLFNMVNHMETAMYHLGLEPATPSVREILARRSFPRWPISPFQINNLFYFNLYHFIYCYIYIFELTY